MAENGAGGRGFGPQFDVESGELPAFPEAKIKGRKKFLVALLRTRCDAHRKLLLFFVLAACFAAWWLFQSASSSPVPATPIQRDLGGVSRQREAGNVVEVLVREQDKASEPHRLIVTSEKPAQPEHRGQEPRAGANKILDADICSELGFDEHSLGEKPLVPLIHNNVTVPGFVNAGTCFHVFALPCSAASAVSCGSVCSLTSPWSACPIGRPLRVFSAVH
eukprot:INCI14362.2.p1 GENE.INCI14362.2~~INCI14362.2.p1  ORF type:complete len:243 (+),score=27.42 INCI14362.2:72-731(+)